MIGRLAISVSSPNVCVSRVSRFPRSGANRTASSTRDLSRAAPLSARGFASKAIKVRDVGSTKPKSVWGDAFPEAAWGWDPFAHFMTPMNAVVRHLNRNWQEMAHEMETFAPSIDLSETPEAYKLEAEIPGLKKEDIKIEFDNNLLTIKGERKTEHSEKKEQKEGAANYHRVERWYGRFQRSWQFLEDTINKDAINASYKDGVLTVTLPKAEPKQPKTIEIQVESEA